MEKYGMIFCTEVVEVMKKAVGKAFSGILAFLITIVLAVCFIFMLPLDYIKYKRSLYHKKEHKKYRLFAASGCNFEIYNEILKSNLPIQFIENPNANSLEYGWFVFENILIIQNVFSFEFNLENKQWTYCCEDEEEKRIIMTLDEYIEIEIQEVNELAGHVICNDAIVLIDGNCIENIDAAKNEKRFMIYEENREETLKRFCENNI